MPQRAPVVWKREAARSVATALRSSLGKSGAAAWRSKAAAAGSLADADPAVVAIARAIQQRIALAGTKPYRYMAAGQTFAAEHLDRLVRLALSKE